MSRVNFESMLMSHVAVAYLFMSHVEFKKLPCCLLNWRNGPVTCQYALCCMSNLRNGRIALSILGF